jgi:hypothetical protein
MCLALVDLHVENRFLARDLTPAKGTRHGDPEITSAEDRNPGQAHLRPG